MVVLPVVAPVTTPVPEPTEATTGLLLLQVPPAAPGVSVILLLTQTLLGPVMDGMEVTVMVFVTEQPLTV